MRTGFSRDMSGAWSAQERVVLDKTREDGKGQNMVVLGCFHVEEFLLDGGQQGAIWYLPKQGWGRCLQLHLASLPPQPLMSVAVSSQG